MVTGTICAVDLFLMQAFSVGIVLVIVFALLKGRDRLERETDEYRRKRSS
jgi:hypothetical protein